MQTKDFVQDLQDEIRYEKEYKYQVPFERSKYYKTLTEVIERDFSEERLISGYFDFFKDLFSYHFEYSAFVYTAQNNHQEALKHLEVALGYARILLQEAPKTCGCFKGSNPFIVSNKATFMASCLLLFDNEEAFIKTSKYLIDSLNGKNCIIKKGYNKATISWFVLKLFSFYTNEEITLHRLLQPKLDKRYEEVLNNWDTTDEKEILYFIDILCELHLAQATLDLADADEHDEDDIYNVRYRELFLPALYTFPYEVLLWLKLRELKGLTNPTKFTHPLMNTPIAKFFLSLEIPLPYPDDLPYAKELLEKLKEQCPNVEIPQWLDKTETPIIPDDFMK